VGAPSITAIDPAELGPASSLLLLNNAHAEETSFLSPERMTQLVRDSFIACRVGDEAFLLAFDQSADYDSPNFRWFQGQFERFVYIDRVVVRPQSRGRGLARSLYQALFADGAAAGQTRVTCEVNINPPNPTSDAFHAAMGFAPVGSAVLANGKTVRYLVRPLP
jgi:predicted GNAT superfamily acetyltransferase